MEQSRQLANKLLFILVQSTISKGNSPELLYEFYLVVVTEVLIHQLGKLKHIIGLIGGSTCEGQ